MKPNNLSELRISKDMKFTALYTAMRFFEYEPDIYTKIYKDKTIIKIYANNQKVFINDKEVFLLNTKESFVKIECINRLLELGFNMNNFSLINENSELLFKGYIIKFIDWDDEFNTNKLNKNEVLYKSRLISGVLEHRTKINNHQIYDWGLFENSSTELRKKQNKIYANNSFEIEENRVLRYIGKDKKVIVPNGIEELESSSFWDNQYIEEVVLPDSLTNLGGDTFYNCKNLKKVNIPKNVSLMGNNPFAGCPMIDIDNHSNHYIYENNALYTKDKKTLIYYAIKSIDKEFVIPNSVEVICKHAFYLCDNLEKITIPKSLKKMENNPFSGCSKLELVNNSKTYYIKDNVIYNGFKTQVVGALNGIKTDKLELLNGIESINRNSFWNCKGIKKIIFPSSLKDIGYNPFVGCSNIIFESNSTYYKVVNNVLYTADMSKLVCYPSWKAKGKIEIDARVKILERGAFSGCSEMTEINLNNVIKISKSCFTNCSSVKNIVFPHSITYIGEWALAHCYSLKTISVSNKTIVEYNALSNTNAVIKVRKNK